MDSKRLRDLREAYGSIYETEVELTEEQVWEEVETWVNDLIEEGYDLSDYTWEEMYEFYLSEAPALNYGNPDVARYNQAVAQSNKDRATRSTAQKQVQIALGQGRGINVRGATTGADQGTGFGAVSGGRQGIVVNKPLKPGETQQINVGGRTLFPAKSGNRTVYLPSKDAKPATPLFKSSNKPVPPADKDKPVPPADKDKPVPPTRIPAAPAKVSPTPTKPTPAAQTGDKTKDMATFAKANPALAAAAAERARTRGTSQSDNPLMKGMPGKRPMTPSVQSPTLAKDLGKGSGNQSLLNNPNASKAAPPKPAATSTANSPAVINRPAPAGTALAKQQAQQKLKPPTPMTQSYEWGSTSKLVQGIANAYSSIYEAKKVDQNEDGHNDFADVRIARLIASGVPKEKAIEMVKNKSYNKKNGLGEAAVGWNTGKNKRGLSPEEETTLKFIQHGLSNKPGDPERAKQQALVHQNMTDAIKKTPKGRLKKVGPIASKRFMNAAIRQRGGNQPSVPIKTVPGLKDANREAQSKRKAEESFELWIDTLINEGYDLSDYTWDEMIEIYEETQLDEATAMAKRGYDETKIRNRIANSTGGGKFADKATALENQPTYGNKSKQAAREKLARTQRGDFRRTTSSSPGLHGYGHKSDDPNVKAKQAARGAQRGVLTPREKKQLNREAYETYELVASYLLENNFATTVEDANVIINNMSENWFTYIIEDVRGNQHTPNPIGNAIKAGAGLAKKVLSNPTVSSTVQTLRGNTSSGGYSTKPGDGKPYKDGPLWGGPPPTTPTKPQTKKEAPMRTEPLW